MQVNELTLYQLIAARLRERRHELRLSQAQLAEASGELRTSISNIEAGHQRIPLHVLYNLCSVLGLEVAEVMPRVAAVSDALDRGESPSELPTTIAEAVTSEMPMTGAVLRQIWEGREEGDE